MSLSRRAVLGGALLAAGCADREPVRTSFPPLRFDYLLKLQLDVASIVLGNPPPPSELEARDPAPPGPTLLQMAQDRLVAGGARGRGTFTIVQAQIVRAGGGLAGLFAVRLDVDGAGGRTGFATAQVQRQIVGGDDLRGSLYDLTAQMMADMNVEFEYQVRHSLGPFLQVEGAAPAPAAVEQQPLSSPARPPIAAPLPGSPAGSGGARPPS